MKILLFRGRGLLSALIRWQTRGRFSHAAVLTRDGWLYEAWQGKGVRKKVFDRTDIEGVRAFEVSGLTSAQEESIRNFLIELEGTDYDYLGVLRFLSRRNKNNSEKWFCSELVYAALERAGVHLFARTEAWEVSPSLLARSPRLIETVL